MDLEKLHGFTDLVRNVSKYCYNEQLCEVYRWYHSACHIVCSAEGELFSCELAARMLNCILLNYHTTLMSFKSSLLIPTSGAHRLYSMFLSLNMHA